MVEKLGSSTEKFEKYQMMSAKLQHRELLHLQHQMNVLRFLFKSIKIGIVNSTLYETYGKLINEYIVSKSIKIRSLALESLGLLMVHDKTLFEEKL